MAWFIFMMFCIMNTMSLAAQTYKLQGIVKDDTGEPLMGATVMVEGTSNGVITDIDGKFIINVVKGQVLTVSYVGFTTKRVKVSGISKLTITLESSATNINEVVVVGYGTTKRSDLTGSISSLSGKSIEGFKSSSVLNAMAGQVAGVQIGAQDGTPGGGMDIKIRGIGTITGDATPLYVVDGFQVDNIDYLASSDIRSIEILKDASAAAIYGSRAANGVVLVTTKSGVAGRNIINVNIGTSYREISKKIDMLSPYEFVKLQTELLDQEEIESRYFKEGLDKYGNPYRYQSLEDYRNEEGIDWQDETFRPTWSHDVSVSLRGGNTTTKYNISYTNFKEDGIFINSGFTKNTVKARINHQLNKVVSADMSFNYSSNVKSGTGTSAENGRFNMMKNILTARPVGGLRQTNEELLGAPVDPFILESEGGSVGQVNPITQANSVDDQTKSEFVQGNLSVNFKISSNLYFRTAGSYSSENIRRDVFYGDDSREAYRTGTPQGYAYSQLKRRWSMNNYFTYKTSLKSFGKIELMLGHELVSNSFKELRGDANEFASDALGTNNMGLGNPTKVTSSFWEKNLLSFFGRLNYNYKERFLLTATLRDDGSSVFAKGNKWTISPSASLAWRISEEKFIKSVETISNLKLRVGWGIVGNDRIPNYLSLPLYNVVNYGANNSLRPVLVNKQLPNNNIGWESSETINLGVDIGLFKNRLNITMDLFQKNTRNLLLEADKGFVSGFTSQYANVGKLRNRGLELTIGSVNVISPKGFTWKTDFNISFIRNTVVALVGDQQVRYAKANYDGNVTDYDYLAKVGEPLGLMYGYKVDGVYQYSDFTTNASTGEMQLKPGIPDISNHLGKPVAPGVIKYRDVDGNGYIDDNDRTVIGNGTPKWFGGITNSFSYKNFDFGFMFQFNYGNDVFNATRKVVSLGDDKHSNWHADIANRWTPENANNARHSTKGFVRYEMTSEYVENGSFLRLKNINLGYTLPRKWTKKLFIETIRLYASAQNLWILSDYSGSDPEVSMRSNNPMTPSVDYGAYPKSRVYSFGIDVQF